MDVTQYLEAGRGTLDGREFFANALNPRVEIDQLQHDRSAELPGLFPLSSVKGERRAKGLNRDKLAGSTFKAETCFFFRELVKDPIGVKFCMNYVVFNPEVSLARDPSNNKQREFSILKK